MEVVILLHVRVIFPGHIETREKHCFPNYPGWLTTQQTDEKTYT